MNNHRVKTGILVVVFFILNSLRYAEVGLAAGVIQLPGTGQTTSYYAGDDGSIRAGVAWPEQRFIVSGDCVVDNLTGLMWPKNGNLAGSMPWNNAIDYANNLTLCGYSDWRLPNITELASLLNAEFAVLNTAEWINSQGMVDVQSGTYWSSTTVVGVGSANYAWYVDMSLGWMNGNLKGTSYFVLPVRSGQSGNTNSLYPANLWKTGQKTSYRNGDDGNLKMGVTWPSPRFTAGTGTDADCVIDNLTGLMWLRNAQFASYMTWYSALDYSSNLTLCGYSDWRMPNRKELLSLVDYSQFLPNGTPFTNAQMLFYWSSNNYTVEYQSNHAWLVGMWRGDGGECFKDNGSYRVFPVRGGYLPELINYYCDSDNDKHITSSVSGTCSGSNCIPSGCEATPGGDCKDDDPFLHPGAVELCDNEDNNCDGNVDEGFDIDSDGVANCFDNCPSIYNQYQSDADDDGTGDVCDLHIGSIASGSYHTVALRENGTVWDWGANWYGQLGDGTAIKRPNPVQVNGLTNVTAITGGVSHNIATKDDGTVWTWGWNYYGQLGDDTTTNRSAPVQVSGLAGTRAVAGGYYHSLSLNYDGSVWAWGYNGQGQVGDLQALIGLNVTTPFKVIFSTWGNPYIIAIAGGGTHSIALDDYRNVWTWGYNDHGQLGYGTYYSYAAPHMVNGLTNVIAIAGGWGHSIALKQDGTVWTWGYNGHGQLGDGTTTDSATPVQVKGLTGIRTIAGGSEHTVALKSNGTVWAWGHNNHGQLGDGTTADSATPVQVKGLTGVNDIAARLEHTVALKIDHTVWTWGYNEHSQLGDGTTTTDRLDPVQVKETTCTDVDGDSYAFEGGVCGAADCDDNDESVHPGTAEICADAKDNNCNGAVDENIDSDGDGYSNCSGDCNDNDWTISSGARDICGDDIDNNCNGSIDENVDNDSDGYTTCGGDCNDNNPLTHPGMTEICDGDDNDCDGSTDESLTRQTTCGVGECASTGTEYCNFGRWGWSTCSTGTGSKEVCSDGKDNDCDGYADSGDGDCFTHYKLKVNISGKGNVVSNLPGISCKSACTQDYEPKTLIALKATPAKGYKLKNWSGACKGTKTTCKVTMSTAKTVTVVFKKK